MILCGCNPVWVYPYSTLIVSAFLYCRYTETARDPGQTPQQLFARLKATTQKGANRMQRIEGILRVIAQDSHSPARVQTAEDSVAKLSAQLIELQQSEAALEGQVGPHAASLNGLLAVSLVCGSMQRRP